MDSSQVLEFPAEITKFEVFLNGSTKPQTSLLNILKCLNNEMRITWKQWYTLIWAFPRLNMCGRRCEELDLNNTTRI